MARIRSADFLPEVFRTDTNKEFLSSTLDQLTQQPKLKQTQGFVGRKFGPGVDTDDAYVLETDPLRANYQLEPGIVFTSENAVSSVVTYPEMIDALASKGAKITRHDRLFSSNVYSWSPLIDFDKFVNHSQYYWLPAGPNSVDVSASGVLLEDDFDITRNESSNTYSFDTIASLNPTITLVRGGTYTFNVAQSGHKFYIQTEAGADGFLNHADNISSRTVLGVDNNGEDSGTITFSVPATNAQQFFYDLPAVDNVDIATFARFDSINAKLVSQLGNIDGTFDLDGKTIVFLNSSIGASADLGWQYLNLHEDAPFESEPFSETAFIDSQTDRYSLYQIAYTGDATDPIIKLNRVRSIANLERFSINYGTEFSNKSFFKNASGFFEEVPLMSAARDTLYYQDSTDSNRFGVINLIDSVDESILDVTDILGKANYISPNGVKFTNGLKVIFRGIVVPDYYKNKEYYVEGVGSSIDLIAVSDLITPESYTNSTLDPYDNSAFDSTGFDGDLNSPVDLDFITINRASQDLNPWTRSNRWVHIDVIKQTATYNNTTAVIDNKFRANRPIIEFEKNLRLFNYGTKSKNAINIIDLTQTDALSNVNNATGYAVDGFNLIAGARIIFANDNDLNVRNKIYEVQFVDPNNDNKLTINLVEAPDSTVFADECLLCLNGTVNKGKVFHYTGTEWIESQQKSKINEPPLFDVFDLNGVSFSNSNTYIATTFAGSKIFSYAVGEGVNDTVLGFPLSYFSIDNLGDIKYDNNLYKDTFEYGIPSSTNKISKGLVRKYTNRTEFKSETGWTSFASDSIQPQVFEFKYSGVPLVLDIPIKEDLTVPAIKLFVNNVFVTPSEYTVTSIDSKTSITLNNVANNASIQIYIISDAPSKIGYYKIPVNLENNTFNENNTSITLGTIRNHYNKLTHNLLDLTGEINGSNNSRDIGNLDSYGDVIIQNSAPIAPLAEFIVNEEYDFFDSVEFNSNSYERYKQKIINYVNTNDVYGLSTGVVLDRAILSINAGKTVNSPFYGTDMLPSADPISTVSHVVTPISTSTYNTAKIHDFSKASSGAMSVYLNNRILLRGTDYIVPSNTATIQLLIPTELNDVIAIHEYDSADASFCPATPSKLGLYPKFKPRKYTDCAYLTPQEVVQGHDGSIIIAFGDMRDDVLLEFESRIYNNIKVNDAIPILDVDVLPGKFRNTDYTDEEITEILSVDFLNWAGHNRLDYKKQDYRSDQENTWNYSTASNKLDGSALKGHRRGIYKHHYDSYTPCITPWEMIGFSEKPTWWNSAYGPSPYTSGNLILWDDLEKGLIKEPGNERVDSRYKRPGLSKIIPTDSEGRLLDPFNVMVHNYSKADFKKSWVFGDGAPVESAWRTSSSYPFALQRLFALTKPAQYFSLNIDRDRYLYSDASQQYMYDNRSRLDTRTVEVKSDTTLKHSYINWIIEYNKNSGFSNGSLLTQELSQIDVRLCYRMASFSDKKYLKIFTDRSSTDSQSTTNTATTGLLLPDQSFQLVLHKNQPITELQYSSVIVQRTSNGYAVHGSSASQKYFRILESLQNNNTINLATGTNVVNIPKDFSSNVTLVPYGFVFTTKNSVINFLVSYGAYLESQGLLFRTNDNSKLASGDSTTMDLNWGRMAQEFLQWDSQGWNDGSVIDLNPAATTLEFEKALSIVDNINTARNCPTDRSGQQLTPADYTITRLDNNFKISTFNEKSIGHIQLKTTSYEHILVLDNSSIFNDLIYQPSTGLRHNRIKIVGFTTFDWNGQLDAQGFILNQDNVAEWKSNKSYRIGNIVKFKNMFWSAIDKIDPALEFDFNKWNKVNYNKVAKGLLPNLSSKAGQITEYYNNKSANLETDVDLLALGLTGFRPRQRLETLDDISQVSFYNGFIDTKGTNSSVDVFKGVEFDKSPTDYSVFENWAIQHATYGASSNKAFIDIKLSNKYIRNNSSIVEISAVEKDSSLHQVTTLSNIFKQSEPHLTTSIFTTSEGSKTDTNLPTAGFVHTDDVDIALYQLSDFNGVSGLPFLDDLTGGSTVWVAKDNAYDWNVYRADIHSNIHTVRSVDNDLEIKFYFKHDFNINDLMLIQGVNASVNGSYKVNRVIDIYTILVEGAVETPYESAVTNSAITADNSAYTTDHMLGYIYKLHSVRVNTTEDLDSVYNSFLPISAKVWVTNNTNNKHATYEKYYIDESTATTDDILVTVDTMISIDSDSGIGWKEVRVEQDAVDLSLINQALLYSSTTNQTKSYLDYIDPVNGKILGIAQENINYISGIDPASYSQGLNNTGMLWGRAQVGNIWWDTANIRYLNYNQADLRYASKQWGLLFPGSTVDIRQWISSDVHPAQYTGPGSVVDIESFVVLSEINNANTITQQYYFWVTNIDSVIKDANKSLSINAIQQYIANPVASGIPYIAFLQENAMALFNAQQFIAGEDTVLHVSYNRTKAENNIFNEFNLIKEDNENDFLNAQLYKKLQDSFIGGNSVGLAVPDPLLNSVEKFGVKFRPRQSMFENRFNALKEYITLVNALLEKHIISTNKNFTLLNASDPYPGESTNKWNLKLTSIQELNHQNLDVVSIGYKYLVLNDVNNDGGWSIYEVTSSSAGPELTLTQVQQYNTARRWDYVTWYKDDTAKSAVPTIHVLDFAELLTVTATNNDSYARVETNNAGKSEIYRFENNKWNRVALTDGTISFNENLYNGMSRRDSITVDAEVFTADSIIINSSANTNGIEARNVIRAINEDLLTDDLLVHKNKLLISMFNYILAEQGTVNWLYKTSLVDVEHKVRALSQYPTYKRDNQDFLLSYLTETKPYHVKIKEFLLKYDGIENASADSIDFDVPSYYDTTFNKFISPVLDYNGVVLTSDQSNYDEDGVGLKEVSTNVWTTSPWDSWFNNRLLEITDTNIVNPGSGYITTPTITVTGGGAVTQATLTARISASGNIINVTISNPGSGYITTPTITVTGGGGVGAIITPVLANNLVRSTSVKLRYDRYEYQTNIKNWIADNSLSADSLDSLITIDSSAVHTDVNATFHQTSQMLRHNNKVYIANEAKNVDSTFITVDMDATTSDEVTHVAGYFAPGFAYKIKTIGTTDFTSIGAKSNTVGLVFRPTNKGIGSGTATKLGVVISSVGTITADTSSFTSYRTNFDIADYTEVDEDVLSGVDRTMGLYQPTANDVGLDLNLLINGTGYSKVQVQDLDFNDSAGFDVESFDSEAFDAVEFASDGSTIYSEGVIDTEINSRYTDLYLGTLPSEIVVDGSEYIDNFHSHSPEELIPGSVFDTLSLTVRTAPGFDYDNNGHGFETQSALFEYVIYDSTTADSMITTSDNNISIDTVLLTKDKSFSFSNLVEYPVAIRVANATSGIVLVNGVDYHINWASNFITVAHSATAGDLIQVFAYEIGGGNQLFRKTYNGNDVGNKLVLPISSSTIYSTSIFVNGTELESGYTASASGVVTVDSSLTTSDSNALTVDTTSTNTTGITTIDFTNTYTSDDFVVVAVFGFEDIQRNHSYPVTQTYILTGVDTTLDTVDSSLVTVDLSTIDYNLGEVNSAGKNKQNVIVELDGLRLRSPEAIRYTGDGSTTEFILPERGNINHSLVAPGEVVVYVNEELQTLSTDYIVETVGSKKQVRFPISAPDTNTIVDVYVTTKADYTINNTVLTLNSSISLSSTNKVSVTTWKDTSQLDLLTSVYVGPSNITGSVIELFDSVNFDTDGFDFAGFVSSTVNLFDLGREITNSGRLWVTLNGRLLVPGNDYTVSGSGLYLVGDIIGVSDTLIVTSMTNDIVPDELSFRIFKDMNGNSAMYKVNQTTELAKDVKITDDVIFVNDASTLPTPNVSLNVLGLIAINGERITYKKRDITNNTISGLRRGTAGTANAPHNSGDVVIDLSIGNIVPNSTVVNSSLNKDLGSEMNIEPLVHDAIWYTAGSSTPSNGTALQDQTTYQAKFVKG